MNDQLIASFDDAQRRSIALMTILLGRLEAGMSPRTIGGLAADLLPDFGFDRWFQQPEIRIGADTSSAGSWRPPAGHARLTQGSPVMISLGPSDGASCGDIGTTIVFGQPDDSLVEQARACTLATCGYASSLKCVGELFIYARTWAANHRRTLADSRSIGHAVLPATGHFARGYPRSAHLATWLRRYQIHFLNPRRLQGFWAIGPQLAGARTAACFRELIVVDGTDHRVLGRDGLDAIGRFDR